MSHRSAAEAELPFFDPSASRTPLLSPNQFFALIDIPLSLITLNLDPTQRAQFAFGVKGSALTNLSMELKTLITDSSMLIKVAQAALKQFMQKIETESNQKLLTLGKATLASDASEDEEMQSRRDVAIAEKYQDSRYTILTDDSQLAFSEQEQAHARFFLKRHFHTDINRQEPTAALIAEQLLHAFSAENNRGPRRYNEFMEFVLNRVIQASCHGLPTNATTEALFVQLTMGLSAILVSRENALVFSQASKKHMEIFNRHNCDEDLVMQLDKAIGNYKQLILQKYQQLIQAPTDGDTARVATLTMGATIKLCETYASEEAKFRIGELKRAPATMPVAAAAVEVETEAAVVTPPPSPHKEAAVGSGGLFSAFSRLSLVTSWIPNPFAGAAEPGMTEAAEPAGGGSGEDEAEVETVPMVPDTAANDITDAESVQEEEPAPQRSRTISGHAPPVYIAANPVQTYIMLRQVAAKRNPTTDFNYNREHKNNVFSRFNAGNKIDAAEAFLRYLATIDSQRDYSQLRPHIPALCNKSLADASVLKLKRDGQLAVDETIYANTPSSQLMLQWLTREANTAANRGDDMRVN
jgi:hypothetical protein